MRIGLKYITSALAVGAAAVAIAVSPPAMAEPPTGQGATVGTAPAVVGADWDRRGGGHGGGHGRGDWHGGGDWHHGWGNWFPWGWGR
jgi:hypothetical protein